MRPLHLILLLTIGAGLSACARAHQVPTAPESGIGNQAIEILNRGPEGIVARFHVQVDPAQLRARVTPEPVRAAQFPQALSYDLDIEKFLKSDSFRISQVGFDGNGDLRLTFKHRHPFPAPDFSAAITGVNRADLGYTGELLILADLDASEVPDHTFFGSVIANTELVTDPDGYLSPGDLLHASGFAVNAFPYVLLADEAKDNRTAVSNGGVMSGSYDAASGGWQQSNIGPTGIGWTGFDYVHGGQEITNSFTLRSTELGATPIAFDVAVLIKYTDPRGVTGRTRRFPALPADPLAFAYRLPFAALDGSVIKVVGPPIDIDAQVGASAPVSITVRDWDASATEAATSDLSSLSDVSLVQAGASGPPVADFSCPLLNGTTQTLSVSGSHTGVPGDELTYDGLLINGVGDPATTSATALVRVTDPEANDANFPNYHFGVDPATLAPSASRAIKPITYQTFHLTVSPVGQAPVIQSVQPIGAVGAPCDEVAFSAIATNSPTSWAWDFGGGCIPDTATVAAPLEALGDPGTYDCTVTATNAFGSSPPFPFSITIAAATPPSWDHYFTGAQINALSYDIDWTAIAEHNGNLAVCYNDGNGGTPDVCCNLWIAQSTVPNPTSAADWMTSPVDTAGFQGQNASMIDYNGRLAIAWSDIDTEKLRIALSDVATPTVEGDWTKYDIADGGWDTHIGVLNGNLAVSHHSLFDMGLLFSQAEVADPTSSSDWLSYAADPNPVTGYDSAWIPFNGGAAIVNRNNDTGDILLAQTATPTPAGASDWTLSTIAVGGAGTPFLGWQNGLNASIAQTGGHLAVGYQNIDVHDLYIAMATAISPTGPGDWNPYVLESVGELAGDMDLIAVNGRLAIAYSFDENPSPSSNTAGLKVARALNCDPQSAADWAKADVDIDPSFGADEGYLPRMVVHNDELWVSYLGIINNWGPYVAHSDTLW